MSAIKLRGAMKLDRSLDVNDPKQREQYQKRLRQAAGMYEKHFLREMVRAMRSTIQHSELSKPSMAENIYRQKLDEQYVESWGNSGGVGLGDQIYQQLIERDPRFSEMGVPSGPIPIKKGGALPVPEATDAPIRIKKEDNEFGSSTSFHFQSPNGRLGKEVLAPWSGRVTEAFYHEPGQAVVALDHGNSCTSRVMFSGQLSDVAVGDQLMGGQPLGDQSHLDQSLSWAVQLRRS